MRDYTMNDQPRSWGDKPYYSLDHYLKNTFDEKVYRLPLDGGMTCPNRDGTLGTMGCTFCCAGGSGKFAAGPARSITEQIAEAKAQIAQKTDSHRYIAYFQAYTNTYAPVDYLREIYTEAILQPEIAALSIATRCDCLPPDVLDLIARLNRLKPVWVELGLQTMHDHTRRDAGSAFVLEQYDQAVHALRSRGITVITHLILGFPGETREDMLASVSYIGKMPIQGVKFHLLYVLKGTALGAQYEKEPFPLPTLDEYADLIVDSIGLLPPEIVIHRMTGDGPREQLLAPLWSTDKKNVLNTIHKRLRERDMWQGKLLS